jgi:signal transduction histidine kinase
MLRLPEREIAAGRPVEFSGTITLFDPGWHLLAIQDSTGGVLVDLPERTPDLRLGDHIEVKGSTSVDSHVPSVIGATLHVTGAGTRPKPQPATAEAVACGAMSYRFVEMELKPEEGRLGDATHTARFSQRFPCSNLIVIGRLFLSIPPYRLAGKRIRVRGVPLVFYSPAGKIDHVRLMFEDALDVDVLDPLRFEPPGPENAAAPRLPVLRTAVAVKSLTRDEANRGYPVELEGVVTHRNTWHSGVVLQDASGGVYIFRAIPPVPFLEPGQRVRLVGRTLMGGFAPLVMERSAEVLGTAPLPKPVRVQPGDVFHGWEENRWAEVQGTGVRIVDAGVGKTLLLFSGNQRVVVRFTEGDSVERLTPLLNARLAVTGVYSPVFDAYGILAGFQVMTSSPAMLRVLEPPPASEHRSIASLQQFDIGGVPQHRIRVEGTVTYRDTRGRVYLQDGDVPLRLVGSGDADPPLGARVVAEGFLAPDSRSPQLEEVRWLRTAPGPPVRPAHALAETLLSGEMDGRLVSVEASLVSRRTAGGELDLSMQSGRARFSAFLQAPSSSAQFPELRSGALVQLTGVCATQREWGPGGSRLAALWIRTPADIVVVQQAPWWDMRRALYAACAAAVLLILALAVVFHLKRNLTRQMGLRSELEEQLLHARKLESVGRLAGGVAHDFNNYLTVILGYSSLLLETFPAGHSAHGPLKAIHEVSGRAASLTRQLLAFSRRQMLQPVLCDANQFIAEAFTTLLPLIGEQIEVTLEPAEHLELISIDQAQFLQVLMNLAVNARDAMPAGGRITFATANVNLGEEDVAPHVGLAPGRYVSISITDTGSGMDLATRERIFEPFFTTKELGQGTGLGLAVVFGIVKQSKGHIEVHSELGEGTTFRIFFPVATHEDLVAADEEEAEAQAPGFHGDETILVVEDQTEVRELVRAALERHGYRVLEAPGPKEALRLLDEDPEPVHLLLTDVVMPEMSGDALAREAKARHSGLRVMYMSGYSEQALKGRTDGAVYLQKPFQPEEVAAAVRGALNRSPE